MQNQDDRLVTKSSSWTVKVLAFLKGLVKALIFNCILAGIFMLIGNVVFHSGLTEAAYSNALFIVAVVYMIFSVILFKADLNSRLDTSNIEMTPTNFNGKSSSQMIKDKHTRGQTIIVSGAYTFFTLVLAYIIAMI